MKKTLSGVLATVIAVSMYTATAFAAGPGGGYYFTDRDGDGICDNAGAICAYADEDGDGVCDNCGAYHRHSFAGNGCGSGFVDEDGDGVCDNYGVNRGYGRGGGCYPHGRHGR